MADPTPPSGYVFKAVSKSIQEAVSKNSHDAIKMLAKSALQSYIDDFFNDQGINRELMKTFSNRGLTFFTNKTINPEDRQDPTRKQVQLARMYNEIREHLPAILIVDSGLTYTPNSLGNLYNASLINGKWQGHYQITAKVPVVISVATQDQETTDLLQSILLVMFGPLKNAAGGSRIVSKRPGDSWEVRLPMVFTSGANTGSNIDSDPKDQIWSTTIDLELDFEDTFSIEKDINITNTVKFASDPDYPVTISAPDTIAIGSTGTVIIDGLRITHKVYIDQPDIAIIDLQTGTITPRKLGSFKLIVADLLKRDNQQPVAMPPHVVSSKQITITL